MAKMSEYRFLSRKKSRNVVVIVQHRKFNRPSLTSCSVHFSAAMFVQTTLSQTFYCAYQVLHRFLLRSVLILFLIATVVHRQCSMRVGKRQKLSYNKNMAAQTLNYFRRLETEMAKYGCFTGWLQKNSARLLVTAAWWSTASCRCWRLVQQLLYDAHKLNNDKLTLTNTHTCFMALCPGLPGWAGTRR